MSPLQIKCHVCGAEAGKECIPQTIFMAMIAKSDPKPLWHREREDAAKEPRNLTQQEAKASAEIFWSQFEDAEKKGEK